MNYNGWDREYLENKELYYELFDKAMAKEPEGPTEELEQAFRDYTGRKHCVPVSSATDALYFSLKACFTPSNRLPGNKKKPSHIRWCLSHVPYLF